MIEQKKIFVEPLKKFDCSLKTAADKSITHRAVMFGAFSKGTTYIHNALMGEDCLSTVDCMRRLGAQIEVKNSTITVFGTQKLTGATLNVGNSGTTMRLLSGLLSGRTEGTFILDGDASIRRRPMLRVIDPLVAMGAKIDSESGRAPLRFVGAPLKGIRYVMPVASAQVKSAILLAGLSADGETTVIEKEKSRDHTERMLCYLGADVRRDGNAVTVRRSALSAKELIVPGDISSAAYPMVLAACLDGGAKVRLTGVGVNETRTGVLDVLAACGVSAEVSPLGESGGEPIADITINGNGEIKPFSIGGDLIPRLIDELPVLAVLACFAKGKSVIAGASELKVKESNRIQSTATLLRAFGAEVEETDDGLIVFGKGFLDGGCTVDPLLDHRIAMSAAVAAACSRKGATILSPECADISYPGFFKLFG